MVSPSTALPRLTIAVVCVFIVISSATHSDANRYDRKVTTTIKYIKSLIASTPRDPSCISCTDEVCLFSEKECKAGRRLCSDLEPTADTCKKTCQPGDDYNRLRSNSPFEFCIDRNVTRYPQDIIQAQCLCSGCLDSNFSETHEQTSEKVQFTMNVIGLNGAASVEECRTHRTCTIDTIKVTAGCFCAFAYT